MAKLYMFGTCSGIEPVQGRHQTSFAIESKDALYLFDAGESCAYTACGMGVDLTKLKAIFLSHPHVDHIGGLPHLLFSLRKVAAKKKIQAPHVDFYTPCMAVFDGLMQMVSHPQTPLNKYDLTAYPVKDGLLFDDGVLRVTAFHNHHLPVLPDGSFESFSYRIETEGKTVVFSADIRDLGDLTDVLKKECDLLMVETGHHKVADVCDLFEKSPVKKLVFMHHGPEILEHYEESRKLADSCTGEAVIAEDRDVYIL